MKMIKARDAVVWLDWNAKRVMISDVLHYRPQGTWCDPTGAAYAQWRKLTDDQRVHQLTGIVIALATVGWPLGPMLRAFATIEGLSAVMSEHPVGCEQETFAE